MPSLYLVDLFSDQIIGKRSLSPGQSVDMTGKYGVSIPNGIDVGVPANVAALVAAKDQGIQSSFGFFTNVMSDDLQTDSKIDVAGSQLISVSPKVGVCLQVPTLAEAFLFSTTLALGLTPTQFVFFCDLFFYQDVDTKSGRFQRSYELPVQGDPDAAISLAISFDGGATGNVAQMGQIVSIPVGKQGSNLVVRIGRTTGTRRLFVGSWTILFQ